jgi:hypothetical protein
MLLLFSPAVKYICDCQLFYLFIFDFQARHTLKQAITQNKPLLQVLSNDLNYSPKYAAYFFVCMQSKTATTCFF